MNYKTSIKVMLFAGVIFLLGVNSYSAEPTSQGRIKFDVDIQDDAGIDTVSKIVTLKNIKASEIEMFIKGRLSRYGTVQVNDALNMIIITDKQPKVNDLSKLVQELDINGLKEFLRLKTESISLKYTQAFMIKPLVQSQLSPDGSILVDSDHNTLVITDVGSKIDFIRNLIAKLDTPVPQIVIEAKIIEISQDYISKVGLDWNALTGILEGNLSYSNSKINYGTSQTDTSNYTPNTSNNHTWDNVSKNKQNNNNFNTSVYLRNANLGDFVNMLVNDGNAKILSSPKIITLNNKSATIYTGDSIMYMQQNSSYENSNRIGLTLNVTPLVKSDDLINLNINAQISDLIGWSPQGQPMVSSRQAASTIDIKNGQTYVMGGIEKTTLVDSIKGVPVLKSIPLIKYLFSKKTKTKITNQVLIYITSRILISTGEESQKNIEQLKKIEK
ncbi:MAG: secretin N-terminal domain-containing protein [Elusimicrobia bacterium]|nr:secretin N-terminal domain-containing protein [Elusimicrobiota bacterium]